MGANILNKMRIAFCLKRLGAAFASALLACLMALVPLQAAFADGETTPGTDPGNPPPVEESPSPPPSVDPVTPTTDPGPPVTDPVPPVVEIPPIVVVPPVAPAPGDGPNSVFVPDQASVPSVQVSSAPSQAGPVDPRQPVPKSTADPGTELQPVGPVGTTPTPSPLLSKSSSAPAAPSHSPSSKTPAEPVSVVKVAVDAATGSPFVVQLLTVLILLAAGFVYFRVLGSRGTRASSKAVK
ncbi:hypothetical protein [Arthrobacter methylotrophus]|uniref:hypothetical protein n=1 Tax=Arthrobacter methylotrophus TaxID=121291 RepID=UPI0031E89B6E